MLKDVEEINTPGTGIEQANVNIVIAENVVDGRIRFVGRESSDNGCELGNNYVLKGSENGEVENVLENVQQNGEDIFLAYTGIKNHRIGVDRPSYRQIKRRPALKAMKSFFVRKNK